MRKHNQIHKLGVLHL